MAEYANILVNAQMPLEDFVRELESLLAIRFQFASDSWEEWYEYRGPQIDLWVGMSDYDSHDGFNFEDYRYDIQVGGTHDDKRRQDFARSVFEKLKETKRYPLLLTDYDLQHDLDEYTPEGFPEPSALVLKARTLPSELILYVDLVSSSEMLSQDLKNSFQAQGLEVSHTKEVDFLLPTMSVFVGQVSNILTYDSIAKTNREISPVADVFHTISVKARVQLPGGLAVPGERRSWAYELMMRLFEHLKVLGRYRLLLRSEAEDRELVAFDPDAAKETP